MESNTTKKPLILRPMKSYKVTYNYFDGGKKMVGTKILDALDRDHAIMIMAMWPRLILKVETL